MEHRARQPGRHRQADDVGRMGAARQDEAAVERRRDVVGMRSAAARLLARHRARQQHVERRRAAEQLVDGDDGGHGAGAAAADAARQRQALVDGAGATPRVVCRAVEQGHHRRAGGVLRRVARQPAAVAVDGRQSTRRLRRAARR